MIDYISRQDAIDLIKKDKIELVEPYITIYRETGTLKEAETQVMTCDRHIKMIKSMPTVDVVERKMGEWKKHNERSCWYCSECKSDNYYAFVWNCETDKYEFQDNFCRNCGADMRGKNNG